MPFFEHYRDYFSIDPEYFPAVNLSVMQANPEMWKKFYPHETFIKLLKTAVQVLDRKQKLSIWVEGSYGTGKSYAVLTLKKLLDADADETRAYFQQYHLDPDLCSNLQRIKESGRVLTVHRYSSSDIHGDSDLIFAIQESVERALQDAGMVNQGKSSLKDATIRYLSDPVNKQSFNVYVTNPAYSHRFGGDDVDDILRKLQSSQSEDTVHALMDKIFLVARERQIRAFTMTASDLTGWLQEVIHANGLKAIVFLWDEFTEYFQNNRHSLTGFQTLCELGETEPFYFVIVTHASHSLFHEDDEDFPKLNDRFVAPHCEISLPDNIAFRLMGEAMEQRCDDTQIVQDWQDICGDLAERTAHSRSLVEGAAQIDEQEMLKILPIHPYAALLLKHIAAVYDSNQRSMFDFIKNDRGDEIRGFQWFIDNCGPGDDNPLLTADMLWEFFYDKGRNNLVRDVRSVLDYYSRSGNQRLEPEQQRVLKTVLLLQAISQHAGEAVRLFIPNEENLRNTFEGSDLETDACHIAEKLVRDRVLFKRLLGSGEFQYNAYTGEEIPEEELEARKREIDENGTAPLIQKMALDSSGTKVIDAVKLDVDLALRYDVRYAAAGTFDRELRTFRNQEDASRIPALVCFAKNDQESASIRKKIRSALDGSDSQVVFIDTTATPLGEVSYERYREEMAYAICLRGKDTDLGKQYTDHAQSALKSWKTRIEEGTFFLFTEKKPAGEYATSMDELMSLLRAVDRDRFPLCPEGTYRVTVNMYTTSNLKQGVECGVCRTVKGTFHSTNPNTCLERALKGAWDDPEYWKTSPHLPISKIKLAVDRHIQQGFESSGRVSIRSIYELLQGTPYGFMPCNLSAFLMGFLLKEYVDTTYSWSDDLTRDRLTLEKMKVTIADVINLQKIPNPRYRETYIVSMTPEEKAFNEMTAIAFRIDLNLCTSVERNRELIRGCMKDFAFPIWTVKSLLSPEASPEAASADASGAVAIKTNSAVLEELVDLYCSIANNMTGKSDNELAQEIGLLYLKNPDAGEDLQHLLTSENSVAGMRIYLETYDNGQLPALAREIGDGGRYIDALREKFDTRDANWVWPIETAQQEIQNVILEYRIIAESNRVIAKNISFTGVISGWCDRCSLIRISFAFMKNDLGELQPFMAMLYNLKKSGTLPEDKRQKFLDLLTASREQFQQFYEHQTKLFQKVCAYYLDGFSEDEVQKLYSTIPAGVFTSDKNTYSNLVDTKVREFKNSLGTETLKALWKEKTGSTSPKQWSLDHRMPILCLIPNSELKAAREAFDTINRIHPDAGSVEKAITYLENTGFYSLLNNPELLDQKFQEKIIGEYAVMLPDVDEVKGYLRDRMTPDPYDWWFCLPEVKEKLRQKAQSRYDQEGCTQALEKIDAMSVDDAKGYLKELIRDNMVVGMEIIKNN